MTSIQARESLPVPVWYRVMVWTVVLLSGCILFRIPQRLWLQGGTTYYVSPQGSDWSWGTSPDHSFCTIGQACRLVNPGDQIIILPGVYQERIHVRRGGTRAAPVTIKALEPGRVTISWSRTLRDISGEWTDVGDGIYSTTTTAPVYLLREGDRDLFRMKFGGMTGLRSLVTKPNAYPAFAYDAGKLAIFLGSRHPQDVNLLTHSEVPEPREWGEMKSANVWVEADHVHISGLRFEFGIGSGVRVWNSQHVEIQDCEFRGCSRGVDDRRGVSRAGVVKVTRCRYDNFPQYHWLNEWLDWKNVYAHYATNGLISSNAKELTVENCHVTQCADGLGVSPTSDGQALIRGNWIHDVTDDGIELDGDACNVEIRQNVIENCQCALGLSPVRVGPVLVQNNILQNDSVYGALFKFLSPWKDEEGRLIGIQNIQITENYGRSSVLCYWNPTIPVNDVVINENLFVTSESETAWPATAALQKNHIVRDPEAIKLNDQQVLDRLSDPSASPSLQPVFRLNGIPKHVGPTWSSRQIERMIIE